MNAKRLVAATAVGTGLVLVGAGVAHADNTAISIGKNATRSASHRIVFVKTTVTCSEDTTDAALQVSVTQTTPGGTQTGTGTVVSLGAFECSGDEEIVMVPVRRPTGGFAWQAGAARASNLTFVTQDPSGVFTSTLSGRTINVR
jgi:hypothetical protein